MSTIARVLTGVATLKAGHAPSGSKSEWSAEQAYVGSYSVKLSKPAIEGSYGSTHVQFTATGNALAQTIQDFEDQTLEWGYAHFRKLGTEAMYWEGMELRFEDPNSDSWVDITTTAAVVLGTGVWVARDLADTDTCYFGGWSELDGSFSNFAPAAISGIGAAVAASAPLQNAVTAMTSWTLTRVRLELWETVWDRYDFIDSVVIDGVTYAIEPGDTVTSNLTLSSPSTELGYTEDGVDFEYTADTNDIEVEEETFPIDRVIIKETVQITCNMAEASLYNMDVAMAGSLLSGSILKLGAGTNKKLELILTGVNPDGFYREITIPVATATGAVGMPYKKDEKTVVPVTFQALKTAGVPAVTIVDNAA